MDEKYERPQYVQAYIDLLCMGDKSLEPQIGRMLDNIYKVGYNDGYFVGKMSVMTGGHNE